MREIHRLLEPGEPILPTDEYWSDAKRKWMPRGTLIPANGLFTEDHVPTRRTVKVSEATERYYSRDEFACAAMAGMCADVSKVEKAMKREPGGQQFSVCDVVADLSYEYADAMIRSRDGQPPREVLRKENQ